MWIGLIRGQARIHGDQAGALRCFQLSQKAPWNRIAAVGWKEERKLRNYLEVILIKPGMVWKQNEQGKGSYSEEPLGFYSASKEIVVPFTIDLRKVLGWSLTGRGARGEQMYLRETLRLR